jgi:hypothetical protein
VYGRRGDDKWEEKDGERVRGGETKGEVPHMMVIRGQIVDIENDVCK